MSFNVKTISVFERQTKRLVKKYPSLKKEIQELIKELMEVPEKGTSPDHPWSILSSIDCKLLIYA